MDESLNQSVSVTIKKPSKKIKRKKNKYINLTLILLIFHCISISVQKFLEKGDDDKLDSPKSIKNIFLVSEDVIITIFIIIFLYKINNDLIITFSILYFLIGIVMLFYFLLNEFYISEKTDIYNKIIYIFNNILFIVEGYLLYLCSDLMEKEKLIVNREKYGYKNNEDILHTDNLMKSNLEK